MRRLLSLTAAVLLAATLFPGTASADTTGGYGEPPPADSYWMEISIQKTTVKAKVVVEFEIDLWCSPKGFNDYPYSSQWEDSYLQVWVKQASGRSMAYGSTDWYFNADDICDGEHHLLQVSVSADPGGVPFKHGKAAVAVAARASYFYQDENWEDYGWISHYASTGWVALRLSSK